MKKIFTFMAALFLSSGAVFAQDPEPEEPGWDWFETYDDYVCHEFRDPSVGATQYNGPVEIVEDPTDPSNHCARVVVRSQEVALAAENMIADGDHIAGWDSQFFVCSKNAIPEGYDIKLVMRVRADYEGDNAPNPGSQAHNAPGDYNHWACVGNLPFTHEWTEVTLSATVSADMTQSANGKEFHSIAFNLADYRDGYTAYFDDIRLYVREPQSQDPNEMTGWFNLLRNGNETDDILNRDGEWHTFTGRDGDVGADVAARVVEDPIDGLPAYTVRGVAYNTTIQQEIIDSETGQPAIDEEGNVEYEEVRRWQHTSNGEEVVTDIDNWQTQFFLTVPHKFATGQQFKLRMWARADYDCDIETQVHRRPGDYQDWQMLGNIHLTPVWTLFTFGDTDEKENDVRTIGSTQDGCNTIAFNCNVFKDEINNYYFRFEDFSFNDADVTIEERTLGQESITLNIPEPDQISVSTDVDFTNCGNTLNLNPTEMNSLLEDGSLTVQRKPIKLEGEEAEAANEGWENVVSKGSFEEVEPVIDPEENLTVQYESELSLASGFPINNKGLYDEDSKIYVQLPEYDTERYLVPVEIYNYSGESFQGKTANNVFFVSNGGWNYRFNVTFKGIPAEEPDAINNVTSASENSGVIYDLIGRRVMKPAKGLYIMNGKKVLVK